MDVVFTLKDLYEWETGPRSFGLFGNPVGHSISPQLHNAALAVMPGYEDCRYYKFEVGVRELGEALKTAYNKGFLGLNLTIPHKVEVMKYLETTEQVAKKMGAVNTLKRDGKSFRGYNTDGYGMEAALKRKFELSLRDRVVILLGAGGVAKAAAMQCLFADCKELWIGNRSKGRLEVLLKSLGTMGRNRVRVFDLAKVPDDLPKSGILINATSLGMEQEDLAPIDLNLFSKDLRVMDMIYNPPETKLLAQARELGMVRANGLSMLVEQAAKSLEIWTGMVAPVSLMYSVAKGIYGDELTDGSIN